MIGRCWPRHAVASSSSGTARSRVRSPLLMQAPVQAAARRQHAVLQLLVEVRPVLARQARCRNGRRPAPGRSSPSGSTTRAVADWRIAVPERLGRGHRRVAQVSRPRPRVGQLLVRLRRGRAPGSPAGGAAAAGRSPGRAARSPSLPASAAKNWRHGADEFLDEALAGVAGQVVQEDAQQRGCVLAAEEAEAAAARRRIRAGPPRAAATACCGPRASCCAAARRWSSAGLVQNCLQPLEGRLGGGDAAAGVLHQAAEPASVRSLVPLLGELLRRAGSRARVKLASCATRRPPGRRRHAGADPVADSRQRLPAPSCPGRPGRPAAATAPRAWRAAASAPRPACAASQCADLALAVQRSMRRRASAGRGSGARPVDEVAMAGSASSLTLASPRRQPAPRSAACTPARAARRSSRPRGNQTA